MQQLLKKHIQWEKLNGLENKCSMEIDKAIYNKANKKLNLNLKLNFIIPYECLSAIKKEIINNYSYVEEVSISYTFENMILNQEDIIKEYLDYLFDHVKSSEAHLIKAIIRDKVEIDSHKLIMYAMGDAVVEEIKKRLGIPFVKAFKEQFGIDITVDFLNCKETYNHYLSNKEEDAKGILKSIPVENKKSSSKIKKEVVSKDEGIIIGKRIAELGIEIREIKEEAASVVIEGTIYNKTVRDIKNNKKIVTFIVSDFTDSICVKMFVKEEKFSILDNNLKIGDSIKVKGSASFDNFEKCITIIGKDIVKVIKETRVDLSENKRTELHIHTKMSAMDGMINTTELIKQAAKWGHKAIAITDHGVVQAFPDAMSASKEYDIKVIYGVEGYLVDDQVKSQEFPEGLNIYDEYVVLDLETTGLSSRSDEIIEIGAVKVENCKIKEKFHVLVRPKKNISLEITRLTGITNDMVKDKPFIDEVLDEFLNFIGDFPLVAHNASFDVSFLKEAFSKKNRMIHNPVVDTIKLSKVLLPNLKKYKLDSVASSLKISMKNHHRADDDAETTAQILIKLFEILKKDQIEELSNIYKSFNKVDYKKLESNHFIILVKNGQGLKNLYRIISSSHMDYFYKKPRIPKSLLGKYREGLIVGSACQAGEVYQAVLNNKSETELEAIASFYDYLEVQPIGNNAFLLDKGRVKDIEELKEINRAIIGLGDLYSKRVVATTDAHYLEPEEYVYRTILMAGQGYKDFESEANLYFRTTDEMLKEFDYLDKETAKKIVIDNPQLISDEIQRIQPIPSGTFPPSIEGSEEILKEMCWSKARKIYGDSLPEIVESRLKRELNSVISNGYAVMYVIAQKLVAKSLEDGYLVGSRGSVGSSFAATMSSITEVNPLPPHYICPVCKHSEFITDGSYGCGVDMPDKKCPACSKMYNKDGFDIPFEVFLGFEGDKEPDIDLNFAGEYQSIAHKYSEELFGQDKVFRAGTIGTIAFKTAYGFVKKFYEEKTEEVNKWEIERLSQCCSGVKRTTGQHPGGIMVVPNHKDIFDFCPIQYPANDSKSNIITTHFDYHSISGRLLKLDILGHDVPSIIRMLQDFTHVDLESIPLRDEKVNEIFLSTKSLGIEDEEYRYALGSLGIPEFGTRFVRQMLTDTMPSSFSDLVRISGLAHGTDVWLNNAQEIILRDTAVLKDVISTRDDIMNYLMLKGVPNKTAFKIMERVRKGKGLSEEDIQIMEENNVPDWYIESCKKIKYMFPKAHAVAYVMMSYRIAYFKVYHPLAFYAVFFTIKVTDFNADLIFKGNKEILKRMEEIEEKGNFATQKEKDELTVLEVAYEMFSRGYEFLPVDIEESDAQRFNIKEGKILPPFLSLQGLGDNAAQSIVREREKGVFSSVDSMKNRAKLNKTAIEALEKHGVLRNIPASDQLTLF